MKMILLGPPGAGKGTHAQIISQKFGIKQLSTGEILRAHIREKSELGKKAKDIIERGELVPDQLVNDMMVEEINRVGIKSGFILDGYPRTIGQADALESFLKKNNANVDFVLNFGTSEKVIIDRLSGRRVCTKCGGNYHIRNIRPKQEGICDKCGGPLSLRKDDEPATIKHRLEMYEKETRPLIEYYNKKGLLREVHGDYDVPELQEELKSLFEEYQSPK
jgi:adenylate kinase